MYEEEDVAVNAIVLLKCNYRVKVFVVSDMGAVCLSVLNVLEVILFCLYDVGLVVRIK